MSLLELAVLFALTAFALYRQSVRHELTGRARFKLAAIYGAVGLVVGGFYLPTGPVSWLILAASIVLSVVIGIARGRLTRLWIEPDGRMYSQGTPLTIALFILLVGSKWTVGTVQYLQGHPDEHGGFGEVLILIALMIAMQAEIIFRRARLLREANPSPEPRNG